MPFSARATWTLMLKMLTYLPNTTTLSPAIFSDDIRQNKKKRKDFFARGDEKKEELWAIVAIC
ncbi:unnamed protein product [Coffea canephora]|uniref:Uncharacterized protein n=1 Tax=Coffea canephora TaxID=49390 RepID=A0A068USS0_COFCA|nr:unnamed protein product [Coffea canephora]